MTEKEKKELEVTKKKTIEKSEGEHTREGITYAPDVDIIEDAESITLRADLPGVTRENLDIDMARPLDEFLDVDVSVTGHGHIVGPVELTVVAAEGTPRGEDVAFQIELQRAISFIRRGFLICVSSINYVETAVGCDLQPPGAAELVTLPYVQELAVTVEKLDAGVVAIRNVQPALGIEPADVFDAQGHQQLTVVAELEDLVTPRIRDPHIVLTVDRQTVSRGEHAGSPGRDDLTRGAVKAQNRAVSPVEDEHVVVGIDTDAGNFTQREALRQLWPTVNDLIGTGSIPGWQLSNRHAGKHYKEQGG